MYFARVLLFAVFRIMAHFPNDIWLGRKLWSIFFLLSLLPFTLFTSHHE